MVVWLNPRSQLLTTLPTVAAELGKSSRLVCEVLRDPLWMPGTARATNERDLKPAPWTRGFSNQPRDYMVEARWKPGAALANALMTLTAQAPPGVGPAQQPGPLLATSALRPSEAAATQGPSSSSVPIAESAASLAGSYPVFVRAAFSFRQYPNMPRRHGVGHDAAIKGPASCAVVPAKTPNSMDVKIGETHAIVQYLLWCPAVWGKSSRAKYHVVVAALTCCFSRLSCAAMHIVK